MPTVKRIFFTLKSLSKNLLNTLFRTPADGFAYLFILLFFISGVLTLPDYGLTWDEATSDVFFGERYLYYFRTLDSTYLDFSRDIPHLDALPLVTRYASYRMIPAECPPLAAISAAFTMQVFSYKLHLLDPVDGWHLSVILFTTVFLFCLYRFFSSRIKPLPALLGIILLAVCRRT